jgi:hypothetical protein
MTFFAKYLKITMRGTTRAFIGDSLPVKQGNESLMIQNQRSPTSTVSPGASEVPSGTT